MEIVTYVYEMHAYMRDKTSVSFTLCSCIAAIISTNCISIFAKWCYCMHFTKRMDPNINGIKIQKTAIYLRFDYRLASSN